MVILGGVVVRPLRLPALCGVLPPLLLLTCGRSPSPLLFTLPPGPPLGGEGLRNLLDPARRGGSSALILGDSVFPLDVGRKLCCGGVCCCSCGGGDVNVRTRSGGGDVKLRTLPFDADDGCFVTGAVVLEADNTESEGKRNLLVSRMKATVDSSFPATLVADSPPRTMSLSREVVMV